MRGGGEQRGTASEAGINAPFGMELPPQKSLQASTAAVEATADSAAAAPPPSPGFTLGDAAASLSFT